MEGVEPPSLITEMHLHLQDLRFEYWYGTETVIYLHVYTVYIKCTCIVLSSLICSLPLLFIYSPLYLPMTVFLGVSSVQLSTSIVAGSPLLVVRILVDHTHLALSDVHQKPASLKEGVCARDWLMHVPQHT